MTCDECRFWSDKLARANKRCGDIEAICLCETSVNYGHYVSPLDGCSDFAEGESVDLEG